MTADARTDSTEWRGWAPEGAAALVVLVLGVAETALEESSGATPTFLLVTALTAAATLLCRRAPGAALAVVWLVGGVHVLAGCPLLFTELAVSAVFFGTARWGRPAVVALGGASVPTGAACALVLFLAGRLPYEVFSRGALQVAYAYGAELRLTFLVLLLCLLGAPWLAGLALRFLDNASRSRQDQLAAEREARGARHDMEQAREIARLQEEQARLAHDVHDVVGHSLAVILAQAEAAQYADDTDTQRLKQTMQTIATSARASLQDVRHVLAGTKDQPPARPGGLDALLDGVRRSGHDVESSEVGRPRPLPPELEVVAYRVLQEMLTNAIRHGRRDHPVRVERHWPDAALGDDSLRIEVRNVTEPPAAEETVPIAAAGETGAATAPPAAEAGHGLTGMRRRLEAVGGRLDVRRRVEDDGPTFTATAWIPVRPVTPGADR